MISICVTVKNRSRVWVGEQKLSLFPNCVRSLADSTKGLSCELVVCDWDSDDWPLTEWVSDAAGALTTKVINEKGHFSRGRGLNAAARASSGEILFFVDADALFSSKDVFDHGLNYVGEGKAFFPVLFSYSDGNHTRGWWRHEGYGHSMVARKIFERSGGWPEYDKWGKEDDDFLAKISRISPIVREEMPGFFHQWHPEGIEWKNRYSKHSSAILDEIERVPAAWTEIYQFVKPGLPFILVDENRMGADIRYTGDALPFLERDGIYWGAPTDDEMAISEFERLRNQGASHIVFGWMCFWWLQYYSEFDLYLRTHYRCVLDNENLIVFDLTDSKL